MQVEHLLFQNLAVATNIAISNNHFRVKHVVLRIDYALNFKWIQLLSLALSVGAIYEIVCHIKRFWANLNKDSKDERR